MKRFTNLSFQGRCCAGQLGEAAKKAAETALDAAHKRAAAQAEPASRRADALLPLLLALLLLAGLTRCAPAHRVSEAHQAHHEHAAPANVRALHYADTAE